MAVPIGETRRHRDQKMDSREALGVLGGSLGGILRGHLAASRYVRAFLDTDDKRPLKVNINT